MKVREVMSSRVRQISSSAMISEAADRMKTLHVGMLPVVENKDIVGTISERDIVVRAVSAGMNPRTTPVREVMTAGAVCCSAEDDVEGAAGIMEEKHARRLVVLDPDNTAIGILSVGDLVPGAGDAHLTYQVIERICESVRTDS